MDVLTTRACEIIETRNNVTVAYAEDKIKQAKIVYDNLYSNFWQRKKALEDIEVYKIVIRMLKRAEA